MKKRIGSVPRDRKKKKYIAFSRLREDARDGDAIATSRLRWHVRRRIREGWNVKTVATRLGITEDQVLMFAGDTLINHTFNPAPRLVRR
jgi:hypothetical protein